MAGMLWTVVVVVILFQPALTAPSSVVNRSLHLTEKTGPTMTMDMSTSTLLVAGTSEVVSLTPVKRAPSTTAQLASLTSAANVNVRYSSTSTFLSAPTTAFDVSPSTSSIAWKEISFGLAGSTLLFIITTSMALVILCRFKHRLGKASTTLYPVTRDPDEDNYEDIPTPGKHAQVELTTMHPLNGNEVVDSPTLNPTPQPAPKKPPRLSIFLPESEAPPVPERRNRSMNSQSSAILESSVTVNIYDNEGRNNSAIGNLASNAIFVKITDDSGQKKETLSIERQLKKEDSTESDVYESYNNEAFMKAIGNVTGALEESDAYEDPVKSRTLTDTSEFIRRQSSLTGLPDVSLQLAESCENTTDAPLQDTGITEVEEIENLADLTCYDDAELVPNDGVTLTNENMYGEEGPLYEDAVDVDYPVDLIPLHEEGDAKGAFDGSLQGIDNPLIGYIGSPHVRSTAMETETSSFPEYVDFEPTKESNIIESTIEQSSHGVSEYAHRNSSTLFNAQRESSDTDRFTESMLDINAIAGNDGATKYNDIKADIVSMDSSYSNQIQENTDNNSETSLSSSSEVDGKGSLSVTSNDEPTLFDLPKVPPRRDILQTTGAKSNYDAVPPPRLLQATSIDSLDDLKGDNVLRPGKSIRDSSSSGPRDSYFLDRLDQNDIVMDVVFGTSTECLSDDVPHVLGTSISEEDFPSPIFESTGGINNEGDDGFDEDDMNIYDRPRPRQ